MARSVPVSVDVPGQRGDQVAVEVRHYDLDVEVDPDHRWLRGRLTVRVRAIQSLRQLDLDLDDRLTVREVRMVQTDGQPDVVLAFKHEARRLRVHLAGVIDPDREVLIAVRYDGSPQESVHPPFDGGFTWGRTAEGQHWVGVSVQLGGAALWWPCREPPSDKPREGADLHFTVPANLVVVSNGRLSGVETLADGRRKWHWRVSCPINSYNITFNAAPFVELIANYEGVEGARMPISYFVLPEYVAAAQRVLPEFVDHLSFLERTFGPYPFRSDKYCIVLTPYIGMEHQSAISYGAAFDARIMGFLWIALHEASHEWWGNLVTASDWRDLWLHEGFAKYSEALYAEHLFGHAAYHEYLARFVRPRIANDFELAPKHTRAIQDMVFGGSDRDRVRRDPYDKGAMLLHTLRYLLGPDVFRKLLRTHAYPDPAIRDGSLARLESSDDFIRRAESAAGQDLGWFFEVYLRQPRLPKLVTTRRGQELLLRWEAPAELEFPMPVDVSIDGVVRRLAMKGGQACIQVSDDAEVVVDPDWWVLRDELPDPAQFGSRGVAGVSLDTAIATSQ